MYCSDCQKKRFCTCRTTLVTVVLLLLAALVWLQMPSKKTAEPGLQPVIEIPATPLPQVPEDDTVLKTSEMPLVEPQALPEPVQEVEPVVVEPAPETIPVTARRPHFVGGRGNSGKFIWTTL